MFKSVETLENTVILCVMCVYVCALVPTLTGTRDILRHFLPVSIRKILISTSHKKPNDFVDLVFPHENYTF